MNKEYAKMNKKDLLVKLNTNMNGLRVKEAKKRLEKYGYNELPKEKTKGVFEIFISAINNPIIYVLIVAAFLSFLVGEAIDGLAIVLIILIDAIVSTIQEYTANKNSEALRSLIKVKVKVIRDNNYYELDSEELVIGDIVVIEPGTKISADMRLLKSNNMTVDESILTGESIGVHKDDKLTKNNIKDKSYLLFSGSSVLTGHGLAVVIGTGVNTELGLIAQKVSDTKESASPLTIRMEKFSKQISTLILVIAFIIGLVLILKGNNLFDIFLSVIALSVSAMPEGLPLALTLALTIGSKRMSKRNVIVKKLNSVESLGSCTVIASDKTGTLTVNEQTAKKIMLPNGDYFNISGSGYDINGRIEKSRKAKIEHAKYVAKLGYINNESIFEKDENNNWKQIGDSIDVAFKVLAYKLKENETNFEVIDRIPYESEKKYSAVFYKDNSSIKVTAKGSVEKILEFCSYELENGTRKQIDKEKILKQNEELASDGYRVIALCEGNTDDDLKYNDKQLHDLSFIGLVGFIDPVRVEVKDSIRKCKGAGIKVIMITGDHALTALAIAKELKIASKDNEVITGEELENITDEKEFDALIKDKKVFARVTPIDKLRIVESLERHGEFVAVTGDGVNDAPAIRVANIGVAMGSGTDVAKETANMIIINDNFTSIVAGIEEGRNAYSNIRKISILLLSCGLAEVLFYLLSVIFDLPIPLVAIQLLWLNLVTDGLQDMALSFERETDTIMREKPRNTTEGLFEKEMFKQVLLSGISMGLIVFFVWIFLLKVFNVDTEVARGYILALMVFMQNYHVLNCRSETKSVFKNNILKNKFILFSITSSILLQVLVMEVPILSRFLQTSSIPYLHLIPLILISSLIIFVMEMYKYVKNNKNNSN